MKKITTEVGVIAAGPAGLAAAIAAAESGVKVAVFEKSNTTGGVANMGMGIFAVESRIQKEALDNLTKEEAFQQYMYHMMWNVDAQIVHDYFWRSADTIDWLMDMGIEFVGAIKNFPDSKATWHVVAPEGGGKHGSRCASAMFKRMNERALELGVEMYLQTPVYKLKKDGDVVCGFYATDAAGEEYEVDAKAVIIATGGFGSNPEMLYSETGYTAGKDMFTFMIPGIAGDGVKMAWEAGVGKGRMMMEKIVGNALPTIMTEGVGQFLNFLQGSPIAVNKAGRRVCDESVMQNLSVAANIIDCQQDRVLFRILDDKMIKYFRKNGQEFPNEVIAGDPTDNFDEVWTDQAARFPEHAMAADSIEELAEKMGVPVDALVETIENYNDMCDQNYDDDFCKPRRYLRAIDGKRFYAYKSFVGAYGSLGGIKINPKYETLTESGEVISGLYAAGSDCCEIYNGTYDYYFPGNTMGFAINSGRIAGENAADYVLDIKE